MFKPTALALFFFSILFQSLSPFEKHVSAQTNTIPLEVPIPTRAFDPNFELVSISYDFNLILAVDGFVLAGTAPNGGGNLVFSDTVSVEFNGLELNAPVTRSTSQEINAVPAGVLFLVPPVTAYDLELNFPFQGELTSDDIDLTQFSQNQGQVFELDIISSALSLVLTNVNDIFTLANGTASNDVAVASDIAQGESEFVVTFNFEPLVNVDDALDLGNIGTAGVFTFDTIGSGFDTELAIWDASGTLLGSNDDGAANFESRIVAALTGGVYFLAISAFDSDFQDGFVNAGSAFEPGEIGTGVLNINGAFGGSIEIGEAALLEETGFFRVEISPPAPVLLGDVNLDSIVSFSDIPAFIAVLQSGEFQAEADCNQDGVVDFSDIPAFITILSNQ